MPRPHWCGTFRPPADGTPDREAVDQFTDFLAESTRRGRAAVLTDPAHRVGHQPLPTDRATGEA